jgi:uncharacterized protein (TIGR02246 family)
MTDDASPSPDLPPDQRAAIEQAVKQAAWDHLLAPDADAALGHYEPDALVASAGLLYRSFDTFAEQAREFYRTLKEIREAAWDEIYVEVLSHRVAVLTATVRWSSTDTAGVQTDLQGVWTAVYVQRDGRWKIRYRHESFLPQDE